MFKYFAKSQIAPYLLIVKVSLIALQSTGEYRRKTYNISSTLVRSFHLLIMLAIRKLRLNLRTKAILWWYKAKQNKMDALITVIFYSVTTLFLLDCNAQ